MMADLLLAGTLNFMGTVDLVGTVKVNNVEVLVEAQRGAAGQAHGQAPAPVPIPPPPAVPQNQGVDVWIFKSFNATVTAGGKKIITQGMCAQGGVPPTQAPWPGMVQASLANATVTVNNIPMNVVGDMGVILPTGAPATFSTSGQ
jgi:hypothetical protein